MDADKFDIQQPSCRKPAACWLSSTPKDCFVSSAPIPISLWYFASEEGCMVPSFFKMMERESNNVPQKNSTHLACRTAENGCPSPIAKHAGVFCWPFVGPDRWRWLWHMYTKERKRLEFSSFALFRDCDVECRQTVNARGTAGPGGFKRGLDQQQLLLPFYPQVAALRLPKPDVNAQQVFLLHIHPELHPKNILTCTRRTFLVKQILILKSKNLKTGSNPTITWGHALVTGRTRSTFLFFWNLKSCFNPNNQFWPKTSQAFGPATDMTLQKNQQKLFCKKKNLFCCQVAVLSLVSTCLLFHELWYHFRAEKEKIMWEEIFPVPYSWTNKQSCGSINSSQKQGDELWEPRLQNWPKRKREINQTNNQHFSGLWGHAVLWWTWKVTQSHQTSYFCHFDFTFVKTIDGPICH